MFSRNQVFFLKFENFHELQLPYSFMYPTHLLRSTRFLLTNVYKRVCRIFLFCLDLELFAKIKKTWFLHTFTFYIFINNSRSEQNKKKSRTPFFRHYLVENLCKISAKNIKLFGGWSSSKFSTFLTKRPGFLEIIDLCLNLGIEFSIT